MLRVNYFIICFLLLSINLFGQNYLLDSSFGINGIARIPAKDSINILSAWENEHFSFSKQLGILSVHNLFNPNLNGYTVMPGLIKVKPNGKSVDSAFGQNGFQNTILTPHNSTQVNANFASTLCELNDGRILVGGRKKSDTPPFIYWGSITCYHPNGTIDTTFANKGIFYTNPSPGNYSDSKILRIAKSGENKILVFNAMNSFEQMNIIALSQNGVIDSTYGKDGIFTSDFYDQSNKRELYFAPDFNSDGTTYMLSSIYDSISWTFQQDLVHKIKPSGVIDSSFGTYGVVKIDTNILANLSWQFPFRSPIQVAQNSNLFLLIDSKTGDLASLAKLKSNGNIDSSFGVNGIVKASIINIPLPYNSVMIRSFKVLLNGQILLLGSIRDTTDLSNDKMNALMVLLDSNGNLVSSFADNGLSIIDGGVFKADEVVMAIQNNSESFIACGTSSVNHYLMIKYALPKLIPVTVSNGFQKNQLSVYPNPANKEVLVTSIEPMETISLVDVSGKIYYQKKINGTKTKIDISAMVSGVYFIHATTVYGDNFVKKIVVQ